MEMLFILLLPAVFGIVVAWLLFRGLRRQKLEAREANPELQEIRSEEHEGMLGALQEWLREPKVVKVLIHRLKADPAFLQELLDGSDALNIHELRAVMQRLLQDYTVRRVICSHVEKAKGLPHRDVMAALLDWARGPKQQEFDE
jgi:hypothetical protein